MWHTYFMYDGEDAIKIGYTSDIYEREHHLNTGNKNRLKVINKITFDTEEEARTAETAMHLLFSKYRIKGEWFESKPILDILNGVRAKVKGNTCISTSQKAEKIRTRHIPCDECELRVEWINMAGKKQSSCMRHGKCDSRCRDGKRKETTE